MIEVESLTKRYPGCEAVNGITFEVNKGEIVGFLGPNGAGKSTTMRILTGYLPATSGRVEVAGHDLLTEYMEVRKKVGYMAEHIPLYQDMTVKDFLRYRGALKGLRGRKNKDRVGDIMERTAVQDVSNKMIAHLSRGYRQRVALADALVNEPELLILDEPTAGLDPKQIRAVRELIRELGKEHTILLSTHILPEVEAICNRALIINKGRIEISDTLQNLQAKVEGGALLIEIRADEKDAAEKLNALDGVALIEIRGGTDGWVAFECVSKPGIDIREQVDALIKKEKWPLREFHRLKASLEDVFVELTEE
ncbi:MAG: ATP-binding cassette domain-containing protein [Verrucomicrobiota bacterium]